IGAQVSAAERGAMEAERDPLDRLLAHFLADRIGATFDGHISGATRAGLFVKLDDTGADGFVPARTIGTEYFRYHEDRHALIGARSGETYRLGDRGTGRLAEAGACAGAGAAWEADGPCGPSIRPARVLLTAPGAHGWDDDERPHRRAPRAHGALRAAHERGRTRSVLAPCAAKRCGNADPRRSLRQRSQGPARQAPPRSQIHAGEIRLPWRPDRSGRPAHAGCAGASSADASAPDEAPAAAERGQGARVRARRHSRNLRGDGPVARRARASDHSTAR